MIKYTKEELQAMPIKRLQNLDIRTKEEENLVQEVINSKISITSQPIKFDYSKVPDIKNAEQEKEWQKKIDGFNEKHVPLEAKIIEAEKVLEIVNEEVKVESVVVPQLVEVQNGEIIKPFCDKCDSKGVRHKKICPTITQNANESTSTV